jgi:hypothetical protein
MPWAKPILTVVSLVTSIIYRVCIRIERKEKYVVAKWDSIEKHARKKKSFDGKWYMDPKCGHSKNEITYVQLSTTIVFQQLDNKLVRQRKTNVFFPIWHYF